MSILTKGIELDILAKNYILACVADEAQEENKTPCAYLTDRFDSEYKWRVDQVGQLKAMTDWLQGLAINIEYMNYKIIRLAVKWGSLPANHTEKQADKILNDYWNFMANKTLQIISGYRLPKGVK